MSQPYRDYLIAQGLLTPRRTPQPDGPTPQQWRHEPTVRLEKIRPRPRAGARCDDPGDRS